MEFTFFAQVEFQCPYTPPAVVPPAPSAIAKCAGASLRPRYEVLSLLVAFACAGLLSA